LLACLLLGGWLAGCATVTAPTPPPVTEQPPVEGWTAEKLVRILSRRDQQFRSLRALATVYYRGPEGRRGFEEAVLVQRPDRLRLETLSALGAILVLTANGHQVIGYHPREGLFFRGQASQENLLRYTQIPLELEEITALLMGLPPITMASDWTLGGSSLFRYVDGKPVEVVTFDPSLELPVRWYRLSADGGPEVSAVFENFSPTPAGSFPLKIIVETAGQQRRLDITYQEPEINVEISPALFLQEKPANAKEIPIEALGK
jgi:outer membrane lipoprotein-sorting protein